MLDFSDDFTQTFFDKIMQGKLFSELSIIKTLKRLSNV